MGLISYIYLWWIGKDKAEEGMFEEVGEHLQDVFRVPARIMNSEMRPPDTFDPARGQFSSTKILRWVLRNLPPDTSKIVAVTDGDLFIPVLTFVFGEAQLGGKGAVVSTARLRIDFNGLPSAQPLFRSRLVKECTHELGHTFGLTHCAFTRCVMSGSNTVLDVDAKALNLCRSCRSLLEEYQGRRG
jgi:archaemetzincin